MAVPLIVMVGIGAKAAVDFLKQPSVQNFVSKNGQKIFYFAKGHLPQIVEPIRKEIGNQVHEIKYGYKEDGWEKE